MDLGFRAALVVVGCKGVKRWLELGMRVGRVGVSEINGVEFDD